MRDGSSTKADQARFIPGLVALLVMAILIASSPAAASCRLSPLMQFQEAAEHGVPLEVASTSMFPGLPIGAKIFAKRFDGGNAPALGDVVAFCPHEDDPTLWVKRVVGLPGDRVQIIGNGLILNGKPTPRVPDGHQTAEDETFTCYKESIAGHTYRTCEAVEDTPLANTPEYLVPPGRVFVLGDNRDHSVDSRLPDVGFVKIEDIVGKSVPSLMNVIGTPAVK